MNSCVSFSKVVSPPLPKKPSDASSWWQRSQLATTSVVPAEEQIAPARRRGGELIVERAHRVGRELDRQDEIGERLHVGVGNLALVAADKPREGDVERLEGEVLVEGVRIARHLAAGAIAAPVHRPAVRHAAQGLRRHRALQRMERLATADRADRVRIQVHGVVGIAEIPGETVEVGEHVAARARRLAVARGEARVVEHRPAVAHGRGLGIVQRMLRDLGAGGGVDHLHGVVEAGEHVEPRARLVERQAAGAAAADGDLRRRRRRERVVAHRLDGEAADGAGAERRDVERAGVRHGERERRGEARLLDARRHRLGAIAVGQRGDVLVQVARPHARFVDDRDARLVEIAAHGGGAGTGPFEPHLVVRFGVADEERAAGGIDGHVEQHGADVRIGRRFHRRIGERVDREHVAVRQIEADGVRPVAPVAVEPQAAARVAAHDQARLRTLDPLEVDVRPGQAARHLAAGEAAGHMDAVDVARPREHAAVADRALADAGGLVAGVEDRGVDRVPVGRRRERARRVAEQLDDRLGRAVRGQRGRGEDPHQRARDARRTQRGGHRRGQVLAAPGGGDEGAGEGAVGLRAGEDDVARLVADQQRAHDARRIGGDVDDADAVGQMVDDPHLAVGARRDRHRLEAHGHGPDVGQAAGRDAEDLQAIIGRIRHEQARAVG